MKSVVYLLLSAALIVGCSKPEPKKEPAPEAKVEAPKPEPKKAPVRVASLSPDDPRTRIQGIPTSVDLEEEANRTVAIENLEAELDRLEAEIVETPK